MSSGLALLRSNEKGFTSALKKSNLARFLSFKTEYVRPSTGSTLASPPLLPYPKYSLDFST